MKTSDEFIEEIKDILISAAEYCKKTNGALSYFSLEALVMCIEQFQAEQEQNNKDWIPEVGENLREIETGELCTVSNVLIQGESPRSNYVTVEWDLKKYNNCYYGQYSFRQFRRLFEKAEQNRLQNEKT